MGRASRVMLRDARSDGRPVDPDSTEMPGAGGSGRYEILGEIARGGMGAVLKGRDPDLRRDLAVKVLLATHADDPELILRFVEEAQIGGQLQHPGVVPVYELGMFAGDRPYFTMKLVRGRTLAALLDDRARPTDDLPRFLGIFEDVCQTVAYAHSRGVIHRDLKPPNVMIGDFGEVQVMDWGLAKVLAPGGEADEARASDDRPGPRSIRTVRSGSQVDASRSGSVMGTPAYMPPEQAGGGGKAVDERADVFGLGSILCEILTGRPAYVGRSSEELSGKAARGDTTDALRRLDASGADADLVALAKDCLAAEPDARPRDARAIVDRLTSHLAGVQDRLRTAELAKAEANARAEEEKKRGKLILALATSLLSIAALVAGGWAWEGSQRARRAALTAREVNQALAEAADLRGRARVAPAADGAALEMALAEVKRAASLLARGDADPDLRARVEARLAAVTRERDEAATQAAAAERDRAMAHRLREIHTRFSNHNEVSQMDADYATTFRAYGIDVDALPAAEAGAKIAARPIAVQLVTALDQWAFSAGTAGDACRIAALVAVADAADPESWRQRLRDAIRRSDAKALSALASTADVANLPADSVTRLAYVVRSQDGGRTSVTLLRAVQREHPEEFWVNYDLAETLLLMSPPRADEAIPFCMAAVAIGPRACFAYYILGSGLAAQGLNHEAIAAYRRSIELKPSFPFPYEGLQIVGEAHPETLAAVMDAYREGIRLAPEEPGPRTYLASGFRQMGRMDEAAAEGRGAVERKPEYSAAHHQLGWDLMGKEDWEGAIAAYREALRLKPANHRNLMAGHYSLGLALRGGGHLDRGGRRVRTGAGHRAAAGRLRRRHRLDEGPGRAGPPPAGHAPRRRQAAGHRRVEGHRPVLPGPQALRGRGRAPRPGLRALPLPLAQPRHPLPR
jgi:serine/threonine-protein kinase